ncbi:hypothetical protein C8R45DRAFT_1210053 [Mycena sanguinolenta]|nr:hypothetical protein C8R45DRAFT_1210053 [Mycena sanguinolenta]
MPSRATRNCGIFRILRALMVQLASPLTRYFNSVPELPISTLDLRRNSIIEMPTVPENATEHEQLVLFSPQQEPNFSRSDRREILLDGRGNAPFAGQEIASSEAGESATIPSVSSVPSSPSPSLSRATPPLSQMSPPVPSDLAQIHLALLDPTLDAKEDNITTDSRIGELGKRRGFKGAPLFTAETAKKPNLLSSPIPLSPRLSPSTPRTARPPTPRTARPSTPRTPLATVTNLLRTPTLKSPKPSIPMECPVSDELQQYYDLHDPFSALGESFYDPDIVCAGVPFANLDNLNVYRPAFNAAPVRSHKTFFKAFEAAAHVKPRIQDTNIYDTIVYSYEPEVEQTLERRAGKSRLAEVSTIELLPEYPSLCPDPDPGPGALCGDSQLNPQAPPEALAGIPPPPATLACA